MIPCGTVLLGYGIDLIPISDVDTLRTTEQVQYMTLLHFSHYCVSQVKQILRKHLH